MLGRGCSFTYSAWTWFLHIWKLLALSLKCTICKMFMADIISHFWLRASTRVRRKMSSKDVSCIGTTMVSQIKNEKGKKIILRKYCWQEPASKCHRATASALLSSPVILQVTWTLCLDISVFAWCCHKPTYLAIVIFSPRGFPIQMFKYIQGQSVSGKNYGILKLFESRLTSIHLT